MYYERELSICLNFYTFYKQLLGYSDQRLQKLMIDENDDKNVCFTWKLTKDMLTH